MLHKEPESSAGFCLHESQVDHSALKAAAWPASLYSLPASYRALTCSPCRHCASTTLHKMLLSAWGWHMLCISICLKDTCASFGLEQVSLEELERQDHRQLLAESNILYKYHRQLAAD